MTSKTDPHAPAPMDCGGDCGTCARCRQREAEHQEEVMEHPAPPTRAAPSELEDEVLQVISEMTDIPAAAKKIVDLLAVEAAPARLLSAEDAATLRAALQTGVLLAGDFQSCIKDLAGNPKAVTPMIREMQAALKVLDRLSGLVSDATGRGDR